MKQKDIATLITVGAVATLISFMIAGRLFKIDEKSTRVPTIQKIDPTFPDVKNDSTYNSFLNSGALDLTVPVQIGDSQNNAPFTGQ